MWSILTFLGLEGSAKIRLTRPVSRRRSSRSICVERRPRQVKCVSVASRTRSGVLCWHKCAPFLFPSRYRIHWCNQSVGSVTPSINPLSSMRRSSASTRRNSGIHTRCAVRTHYMELRCPVIWSSPGHIVRSMSPLTSWMSSIYRLVSWSPCSLRHYNWIGCP